MKLTVIGMWGGFPKKDGPCSGYLIEHENAKMLVDCGSGVLVKLQDYVDINEIHDVVLSHYHYDHYSDIGAFMFSRLVNHQLGRVKRPLTIYGPDDPAKREEFSAVPHTTFQGIGEHTALTIGPFRLSFLKNIHPVETYSIKIECDDKTIVYTADTFYFNELAEFSKEADLLIAECSLYEGMDGEASGHMNAKDAGLLVKEARAKRTILTHLPHYGNVRELAETAEKVSGREVELANVGMSIEL